MSDTDNEPDYKSRFNSLNKLTIVSGAKSQVRDAQGNLKRKYARTNIKIPNNKQAKLADTFGTPLSVDKIKSGDFSDNMKWNIYKTDVEPQLMNRMVENDDENLQKIVEAALVDENVHKAELTVDQATLDRQREMSMKKAHEEARKAEKLVKYAEKLRKRNQKREEQKEKIAKEVEEFFVRQLDDDLSKLAPHKGHPEYDRAVQLAYKKNQRIRERETKKNLEAMTDYFKENTRIDLDLIKADAKDLREKKGAEKRAEKKAKRDETAARKAAFKAEVKAEKAAKQQAQIDAKAAKKAEIAAFKAERKAKQLAQQAEKQAERAAFKAEQAKAKAKYDARVAKRASKPEKATTIQNAFRNHKARAELNKKKEIANKHNEFLEARETMKKELKAKSASLTAKYGEGLFPKSKVGRPAGSKNRPRSGGRTVLRGMIPKGKNPAVVSP